MNFQFTEERSLNPNKFNSVICDQFHAEMLIYRHINNITNAISYISVVSLGCASTNEFLHFLAGKQISMCMHTKEVYKDPPTIGWIQLNVYEFLANAFGLHTNGTGRAAPIFARDTSELLAAKLV